MAERTIDLRKSKTESRIEETPSPEKRETIEWSALEFEERERGPYWFLLPGAGALGLILFGVFTRSYFFVVFVVLALAVYIIYARRTPRELHYVIREEGVQIGKILLPFSELKSFWIFERPRGKELSLETKKTLTPFVYLPMVDVDPEEIRGILGNFLVEAEHKELASDQIARSLGL